MNPLKARQKYVKTVRYYDSFDVSHPESNPYKLIDYIAIGILCR